MPTVNFKCPYCSRDIAVEDFIVVDVDKESEQRDRCVSGEIFQQTCSHCHQVFLLQVPLLYIDKNHKFLIYVSNKEFPQYLNQYVKPFRDLNYTLRRCETVGEFSEKIKILETGVSDILVELAKYDSFIEFIDNKKGVPEEITDIVFEGVTNDVMKIVVRTGDKGMAFFIPMGMLEEEMSQIETLSEVEKGTFTLINRDWMISLFTKTQGNA